VAAAGFKSVVSPGNRDQVGSIPIHSRLRRISLTPRASIFMTVSPILKPREHMKEHNTGVPIATCVFFLFIASIARPLCAQIESIPLNPATTTPAATRFEHLTAQSTGIDFAHRWTPPEKYKHEIANSLAGGGVCIGDIDADGLPDLLLTRPFGGLRLYRNLGEFRFENVTRHAGLTAGPTWSTGAVFIDIDNDDDLDLYVCGYDCASRLYINRGDGTFEDQTERFGLYFHGAAVAMAFADYDLDGDLDAYLLTNTLLQTNVPAAERHPFSENRRQSVSEQHDQLMAAINMSRRLGGSKQAGMQDLLYRNNLITRQTGGSKASDPVFTNVSEQAGISGNHPGLGATWWDYNDDGRPDLYVCNDFKAPDLLYRNNGDGTFTNTITSTVPHTPWFSMGAEAGDINNDGRIDLLAADMAATTHYQAKQAMGNMEEDRWFLNSAQPRQYMRNALYLNSGSDRFMEAAYLAGLAATDWTWSVKLADLDNDTRIDLFIANGMTRNWLDSDLIQKAKTSYGDRNAGKNPIWYNSPRRAERNMAFANRGDLRFEPVTERWGLGHVAVSYGAAVADLDRDGDLDLVVNNFDEPLSVYRNRSAAGNGVLIRLIGTVSNRYGCGTTVTAKHGATSQVRYLILNSGYMSANEPIIHFGLGRQIKIDRLVVRWPSGHVQQVDDLLANHLHTITEPVAPAIPKPETQPTLPLFTPAPALNAARHIETEFDDYHRQPLLPKKLSQLGPGMAWSDVDHDGDDDLYLSGAAGQIGMLYRNIGNGQFTLSPQKSFTSDRDSEDMAPLFFDADGDGDADLYVVSGGVECEPADPVLRDRLYLNDGHGNFTAAPKGTLPDLRSSGGPAAAADFDRDGDLDLFIGGRLVPGRYPLTPDSHLLLNEGGTFTDITDQLAASLRRTGMVTAAVWSDADADGWIDLLVTHEWGPVKFYRNVQGQLIDRTSQAGLDRRLGWFNGIAARDADADGDIDYVVTNTGLNTRYGSPTNEKPISLFYGDFEGTGRLNLVEAVAGEDGPLPVRGRSCSANAMPFVSDKFPTFDSFAAASLTDIYTQPQLDSAIQLKATNLQSGLLLNDGSAHFTWQPLPRIAQAAPGYGVVFTELDGDGHPDLYLVQNFFSPEPETGRMDGGVSLLLTGNGDGTFTPVWPDRSGLFAPGDTKALSVVDLNHDNRPDLVATVNNDHTLTFTNRTAAANRILKLRLHGPTGNPTAVGARVTVQLSDTTRQTAEVCAGSSYLSQSSGALFFGLGPTSHVAHILVRWPDGRVTQTTPSADQYNLTLKMLSAHD